MWITCPRAHRLGASIRLGYDRVSQLCKRAALGKGGPFPLAPRAWGQGPSEALDGRKRRLVVKIQRSQRRTDDSRADREVAEALARQPLLRVLPKERPDKAHDLRRGHRGPVE